MKVGFYLVVTNSGSVRVMKSRPNLNWDEVAIHQLLELPDALFSKPALMAHVVVPDAAAVAHAIDAEVATNAEDAIRSATGLEVRLTVAAQEVA